MSNYMSLKEFYEASINAAINADPRGKKIVLNALEDTKKEYEKITDEKKKIFFDTESLTNPYADTRILNGEYGKEIKKIFCGIDMGISELILADRLNEKNANIDLVVTHHPNGHAYAKFYEVINMQTDIHALNGIPINRSEAITKKRISAVERSVSPSNHMRDVDAAKLLNLAYVCMHTVADNHVENFLTKLIEEKKTYKVSDILDILNDIEEYKIASKNNNPPKLYNGNANNRSGKVIVDMTGGASPDVKIISAFANAGVGTLVVMHLSEKHLEECQKYDINVVCAGHIASDSLGLNLLFKAMRENTKKYFEIIPASGYILVER